MTTKPSVPTGVNPNQSVESTAAKAEDVIKEITTKVDTSQADASSNVETSASEAAKPNQSVAMATESTVAKAEDITKETTTKVDALQANASPKTETLSGEYIGDINGIAVFDLGETTTNLNTKTLSTTTDKIKNIGSSFTQEIFKFKILNFIAGDFYVKGEKEIKSNESNDENLGSFDSKINADNKLEATIGVENLSIDKKGNPVFKEAFSFENLDLIGNIEGNNAEVGIKNKNTGDITSVGVEFNEDRLKTAGTIGATAITVTGVKKLLSKSSQMLPKTGIAAIAKVAGGVVLGVITNSTKIGASDKSPIDKSDASRFKLDKTKNTSETTHTDNWSLVSRKIRENEVDFKSDKTSISKPVRENTRNKSHTLSKSGHPYRSGRVISRGWSW